MSVTLQASHAHLQRSLSSKGQKTAAVYLGQLSAGTYSRLSPRMQAACRELVRLGEMSIEDNMQGQPAARSKNVRSHATH